MKNPDYVARMLLCLILADTSKGMLMWGFAAAASINLVLSVWSIMTD